MPFGIPYSFIFLLLADIYRRGISRRRKIPPRLPIPDDTKGRLHRQPAATEKRESFRIMPRPSPPTEALSNCRQPKTLSVPRDSPEGRESAAIRPKRPASRMTRRPNQPNDDRGPACFPELPPRRTPLNRRLPDPIRKVGPPTPRPARSNTSDRHRVLRRYGTAAGKPLA